jgi:uncharacterized membrane-anchored protein
MIKLVFLIIIQFFFLISVNASEINQNDPFYKLGWKNLEDQNAIRIQIPDANASLEIVETEIYLDTKEDIKNYEEFIFSEETNIEDIQENLLISDRDQFYSIKVQYFDEGYITTDRFKNFTSADIMTTYKGIQKSRNLDTELKWILEPNLTENKVSNYAYQVNFLDEDFVSYFYYSNVLGREGYLELKMTIIGDGSENQEILEYYSDLIKELSSTVEFNDEYKYSDFVEGDYISSYTLTNIIDGSWGEGVTTDLTNIGAYCLVTKNALTKAGILSDEDHARFAGKVLYLYITDVRKEIFDLSDDDEMSVLSGMNGFNDKQNYQKLNISSNNINTYDIKYTNIIELVGDKPEDKVKYEYNNKLVIKDGKPTILFAKIDQTGLSFNKWDLVLACQDEDYTDLEKSKAKVVANTNKPEWFDELVDKVIKENEKIKNKEVNKEKTN